MLTQRLTTRCGIPTLLLGVLFFIFPRSALTYILLYSLLLMFSPKAPGSHFFRQSLILRVRSREDNLPLYKTIFCFTSRSVETLIHLKNQQPSSRRHSYHGVGRTISYFVTERELLAAATLSKSVNSANS